MKRILLLLVLSLLCIGLLPAQNTEENAALSVIQRYLSNQTSGAQLDVSVRVCEGTSVARFAKQPVPQNPNLPTFAYCYHRGKLSIAATDGVSACRAFYDFVRATESGISSWSYDRLQMADKIADRTVMKQSPFQHHQYMNVVTFGYSCPFWDEQRWDEEIDWMALHGIDMPLVLIGAEQVYREVFLDLGLTSEEIDAWEVGPAHLPWFRMGNLSGNSFDGPLGDAWNQRQEQLCKHVLQRMRELGMQPICPAFGGFVPPAYVARTGVPTDTTGWDWMPRECRNYRISPLSAEFVDIGRRFIQKWESKFGKGLFYISDSFNEMEIPSDLQTLTCYGDSVYRSITAANPDAVWVTQGWTFVWQYGQWGRERFEALTRNVPDDKMLVLYMSPEYDPARYWNTGGEPCYRQYGGFVGKQWAYTLLPNMGGKNFYTGDLAKYAWDFPKEIAQYGREANNLTVYGITAEGIENNEMLYELIMDAGWSYTTRDVQDWMRHYARCRYGACPPALERFYQTLLHTNYGKYIDHPRFGWQNGAVLTQQGSAVLDSAFYVAVEDLMRKVDELQTIASPALETDLAEVVAMYLGGRADQYGLHLQQLLDSAAVVEDTTQKRELIEAAERWVEKIDFTLLQLDSAIAIHPQRLERWEQQAVQLIPTPAEQQRNARNARRIVTIWYGNHVANEPVQDYAAHIWSGLVRDYYRPRVVGAWNNKILKAQGYGENTPLMFSQVTFENAFVNNAPNLTPTPQLPNDKIQFLSRLILMNR